MQVSIPDDIYNKFRVVANWADRPVETVIVERLRASLDNPFTQLPNSEQIELAALRHLSNDTLQTIAREQTTIAQQKQLDQLMQRNSLGTILPDELIELEGLVERGDRLMLRKSEALILLQQRGFPIQQKDLAA